MLKYPLIQQAHFVMDISITNNTLTIQRKCFEEDAERVYHYYFHKVHPPADILSCNKSAQ